MITGVVEENTAGGGGDIQKMNQTSEHSGLASAGKDVRQQIDDNCESRLTAISIQLAKIIHAK